MSVFRSKLVRLLSIGALLALAALIVGNYASTSQAACERTPCHSCPHEVCVSACWADGTYIDENSCTKVKHTVFAPIECPAGGGCITQSCN
jgi:hypothetical protein